MSIILQAYPFTSQVTYDADTDLPVYDRAVDSEVLRNVLKQYFTNGVFASPATSFKVYSESDGLNLRVMAGAGNINGCTGYNHEGGVLAIEPPGGTARTDAIVLRWDESIDVRRLLVDVVKGNATTRPAPTRTETVYELVLAYVTVRATAAAINAADIEDTRLNTDLCGLVRLPMTVPATDPYFTQIQATIDALREVIGGVLDGDAYMLRTQYSPGTTTEMVGGVLQVTSTSPRFGTSYPVDVEIPAGYTPAATLKLDGDTVQVVNQAGENVELDAAAGVVVSMNRRGANVFPKMGGATVNYDVVGSTYFKQTCGHNVLPCTFTGSSTHNGIAFTRGTDGSITINGTASATAMCVFAGAWAPASLPIGVYPNGTAYRVIPLPEGVYIGGNGWSQQSMFQCAGDTATVYGNGPNCIVMYLAVRAGVTVDNYKWFPMMCVADTALQPGDYVAYSGSVAQTTPTAKENRIWVKTSTAIPSYYWCDNTYSAFGLASIATGTVIVVARGGSSGRMIPFKGNRGAGLSPTFCYQWTGSSWALRPFSVYQNGTWTAKPLYLHNPTDPAMFSWGYNGLAGGEGHTRNHALYLTAILNSGSVPACTCYMGQPIDVTGYSTLRVTVSGVSSTGSAGYFYFGLRSSVTAIAYADRNNGWAAFSYTSSPAATTYSVNVSGITGAYYPVLWAAATGGSTGVGITVGVNNVQLIQ